jgi:hypothetical protein
MENTSMQREQPDSLAGRETRTVCSWCEGARERTEALTLAGYAVSHGICPVCPVRVRAAQVPQVQEGAKA